MIQIQDILRAGHVPRWQLCDTSRTQSIAEHMFNVAFIIRDMCVHMGIHGDEQNELVMYGLRHDLDEVITGDMPTVTKSRLRNRGCEPNGLIQTPDIIINDEFARQLVKTADLIESTWWLGEHGVGRHAATVAQTMVERLDAHLKNTDLNSMVAEAGKSCWQRITEGKLTI